MIQDARQHSHRAFDTYSVCSAKVRVRQAARRTPHAPPGRGDSAKDAAARVVAENPAATAAVAFAVLAALGPGRLLRAGLMAGRLASLAMIGWRAFGPASGDHPNTRY
ncbi:MAG: hypothetical protein R3B57_03470 [Phycisphaerales bacterium]